MTTVFYFPLSGQRFVYNLQFERETKKAVKVHRFVTKLVDPCRASLFYRETRRGKRRERERVEDRRKGQKNSVETVADGGSRRRRRMCVCVCVRVLVRPRSGHSDPAGPAR